MRRLANAQPRFWLTLIVLTIAAMCLSFTVSRSTLSISHRRAEELKAQATQLFERIGDLEKDIEFAKTDEYIQRVARDELGLMMPGEVRYVSSGE